MRSILDQLDSDEAVLLMYLADELPPGDRARVEKRLAEQQSFRSLLNELATAQQIMQRMFEETDARQTLAGNVAASQRKLTRMIRQWAADQALHREKTQQRAGRRLRFWPLAAAAAVVALISGVIWWGLEPEEVRVSAVPQELIESARRSEQAMAISLALDFSFEDSSLGEVERELRMLAELASLTRGETEVQQ